MNLTTAIVRLSKDFVKAFFILFGVPLLIASVLIKCTQTETTLNEARGCPGCPPPDVTIQQEEQDTVTRPDTTYRFVCEKYFFDIICLGPFLDTLQTDVSDEFYSVNDLTGLIELVDPNDISIILCQKLH